MRSNKYMLKLKSAFLYFSLIECEQREYSLYAQEYARLDSLTTKELSSRYVNTKAKLEHKKNVLLSFLIIILTTVLTKARELFVSFCQEYFTINYADQKTLEDIASISIALSAVVYISAAAIVLILLMSLLSELFGLHKKLLVIEEVRQNRKDRVD